MKAGPAYVYRCYGENERLLYVGMTINLWARLAQHRRYTWWASQVVRVRAAVHPTRERARIAERAAIRRGRPRWNLDYYFGAATRFGWDVEHYEDYVLARYRSCAISDETYQHLQGVRRECEAKFGHVLDIGSPPPPRPAQFLPPTTPAGVFASIAADGLSVDEAAFRAAAARGVSIPRKRCPS